MPEDVFVVDDDALVCRAMGRLVATLGFDAMETNGAAEVRVLLAGHASAGRRLFGVLLDLQLQDGSGADLVPFVRKLFPAARIVIVSGHLDDGFLPAGLAARIQEEGGFVLGKPVDREALATALRRRSPSGMERAVGDLARSKGLRGRQRTILELVVALKKNREIAEELGIATSTVGVHVARLLEKFGCAERRDLTELCRSCDDAE